MASALRTRLLAGMRWSTGSTIASTALSFGVSVVLARLLAPEVFGLVAMFMVFRSLCEVVAAKPMGSALLFYRDAEARDLSATFWVTTLVGSALALALFVGAPWIAAFYDAAELVDLTRLGAALCVLNGAATVPDALLRRDMRFDTLARTRVVALVIGSAVTLSGAVAGWGGYALVIGEIVQATIELVSRAIALRFVPGFALWTPRMPDIARYGRNLWLSRFFTFLAWQSDRLVLGRSFGAEALGLYQRAMSLPLSITTPLVSIVESVMLPTLMHVHQDPARLKNLSLRAVSVSAFVFTPLLAGLALVAEPLVLVLLGAKWMATVPLLQITSLTVLLQNVGRPLLWLYQATGNTGHLARWTAAAGSLYAVAMLIAASFGSVRYVALTMLLVSLVLLVPRCAFAGRLVGIRPRDVARALSGSVVSAAGMLALVFIGEHLLGLSTLGDSPLIRLVVLVVLGAIGYLATAVAVRAAALQEALSLLPSRRG